MKFAIFLLMAIPGLSHAESFTDILLYSMQSKSVVRAQHVDGKTSFEVCETEVFERSAMLAIPSEKCRQLIKDGLAEHDAAEFSMLFADNIKIRADKLADQSEGKKTLQKTVAFCTVWGIGLTAASFVPRVQMRLNLSARHPWIFGVMTLLGAYAVYDFEVSKTALGEQSNSLYHILEYFAGHDPSNQTAIDAESTVWDMYVETLEESLKEYIRLKYFA